MTKPANAPVRTIPGRPDVVVIASAVQHGDADITDRAMIVGGADAGLTPDGAGALAALMLETAAEVGGWIR